MTHTRINTRRRAAPRLATIALLLGLCAAGSAQAVTLFDEDFEGYDSFPDEIPNNDYVNAGIAKTSEGASEVWYGARFETPDDGTIDQDLAIQKFGGDSNNTHTGRTEDDAGMLFKINTTGLSNVKLSFNWRTFLADNGDRFVVGYHVGPIAGFDTCTGDGETGCFNSNLFATTSGLNWYTSQSSATLSGNWNQLLRDTKSNTWQSESFTLGNDANNQSEVWVAFWLDNGEGDYAKFDNVLVTAVPEADTYAMLLAGLGLVGYSVSRRKRSFS